MYKHDISKFTDLRDITGLSSANLSNHLGKLEAGGLVDIEKYFEGKKPTTAVYLTELGKKKLKEYFADHRRIKSLSHLPEEESAYEHR